MAKIVIIGSGFVGQATGITLGEKGHDIFFLDTDEKKVDSLSKNGHQAFHPENFGERSGEIFFLTVPTPSSDDGSVNLSYIETAAAFVGKKLAENSADFPVVVVKSTVPPETTETIVLPILEKHSSKKSGVDFGLAMMPEYLREIVSIDDARSPRAIAIGTNQKNTFIKLESIFKSFGAPIIEMSPIEAEFQKYVHNCFNAAKISFFNEMREIGETLGLDSEKVFHLTAQTAEGSWNPFYGTKNLGHFDGNCLPKDTAGLFSWAKKRLAKELTVLKSIIDFNKEYAARRNQKKN